MGSDPDFVDYVVDQIDSDCGVVARRMFGEYGLFADGVMVAMVCDNGWPPPPIPDSRREAAF